MDKKTTVLHLGLRDWRKELEQQGVEELEWIFFDLSTLTQELLAKFVKKENKKSLMLSCVQISGTRMEWKLYLL